MVRIAGAALVILVFLGQMAGPAKADPAQAGKAMIDSLSLDMAPDDLKTLYSRHAFSNERLPGRLQFNDAGDPQTVGVRFRGGSSRGAPKKAFNIRLTEPDSPVLFGKDRFIGRSMWRDPSMLREHSAYWVLNAFDIPASRTRYLRFYLNDVFEGLYLHVERVDQALLAHHGLNPEGTLVRDRFRRSAARRDCATKTSAFADDLSHLNDTALKECLARNFDSRGDPEWEALVDLVRFVQETPAGDAFEAGLRRRVDVDALIAFMGVHALIGDRDTWRDDYWLYLDTQSDDARWQLIPWDFNLTFGSHTRPDEGTRNDFFSYEYLLDYTFGSNRLFGNVLETPSLRAELLDWLRDSLHDPRFGEAFESEVARVAEHVGPWAERSIGGAESFHYHPANHFSEAGTRTDHVRQVLEYRVLRSLFLERKLAGGFGEGERHRASVTVADHVAGEPIWLVDDYGFVVGRVLPEQDLPDPTRISLEAVENTDDRPLARDWILETSVAMEATISVYYRNDIGLVGHQPVDDLNWFTGCTGEPLPEAAGDQSRLALVALPADRMTVSDGMAYPLINRIDVRGRITSGAPIRLVSRYRQ